MTKDTFWRVIEDARASTTDCEQIADHVTKSLRQLPPSDILAFAQHIDACLDESYRYDLWAVAYIVNGGCSDDGFEYFRGWLIVQGREYFEAALRQPERAADRVEPGEGYNECEDILYAAPKLFIELTSQDVPKWERDAPLTLIGTPWTEDDLERLYPDLWERYSEN